MLKTTVEVLEREAAACDIQPHKLPRWDRLSADTFNYWKDVLSFRAPEAFAFYQTFEMRSRFFAGMFWAGALGVLGAIYAVIEYRGGAMLWIGQLLALSAAMVVAFGLQLRRVRQQEARVLLTLFVAFTQSANTVSTATSSHSTR